MAVPAHYHARAALEADLHVQVEVDRVVLPSPTPGEAVVEGRVARVFRGDPALLSSRISFEVSCLRDGDLVPPSGIDWKHADTLAEATVIEVYLNRWEGGYAVAFSQSYLLDAVTDAPRYPFTEEDAREPAVPPMSWRERLELVALVGGMILFLGGGLAGFVYAFRALLQ
ncbi:hypothetical protein [Myxococcus sp. CA039A]|uniref:hypothetical protein n=1 Tax=Myxococcus sp. CA039A TaxID=2741737 RepID=UPI00157BA7AE|nr:hypothetical protein [Myxococcus sp. CA039A]NTX56363.1 hypothetical protein [Myxococcus sp. CA039A]